MSTAASPQALHHALARAFNARDVQAALTLYEPGGALVGADARLATGSSLAEALEQFFTLPGTMVIETIYAVAHDGLAWHGRPGGSSTTIPSSLPLPARR